MSYNFDPREVLKLVSAAAGAGEASFPPVGAVKSVSEAIAALKDEEADAEEVSAAEQLSVLLYRLEVASWAGDRTEPSKVRAAIAAWDTRESALSTHSDEHSS